MNPYDNLRKMQINLPKASAPAANYRPWHVSGNLAYTSGQLPLVDGRLQNPGQVGAEVLEEDAVQMARLCATHVLSQLEDACNALKLDGLKGVGHMVKLTGYINSAPDFDRQHIVMNGASDLLVEVLGNAGRHARSAVGVNALPLGACIEIEAIAALKV